MKLEDQLITKEQAKRLKELGVTGNAIWYWVYTKKEGMISTHAGVCHKTWAEEIVSDNEGDEFDHEMSAAYSVAELGEILPPAYDTMKSTSDKAMMDEYVWRGYDMDGIDFPEDNEFLTEAQCRAQMVIMLLERSHLKAEEINNRLNS